MTFLLTLIAWSPREKSPFPVLHRCYQWVALCSTARITLEGAYQHRWQHQGRSSLVITKGVLRSSIYNPKGSPQQHREHPYRNPRAEGGSSLRRRGGVRRGCGRRGRRSRRRGV